MPLNSGYQNDNDRWFQIFPKQLFRSLDGFQKVLKVASTFFFFSCLPRGEELRNSFCLKSGWYSFGFWGMQGRMGGIVLDRNMFLIFDDDSQESAR